MDFVATSIMYILIILVLVIIHLYQIKYRKIAKNTKVSKDFSGIDMTKLQENYKILNKMLNNIKEGTEKYDEKTNKTE
jgi:hypothetical protein